MGIKGLAKLLNEKAPKSIKEQHIKNYMGRAVAIDASMFLYQFLIAVRSESMGGQMTNSDGDVTSHVIGMFYRTIRMRENGIKPVYVFDGKAPTMKSHELKKRKEAREKAQEELDKAAAVDDEQKVAQMERRLVRVSKKHVEDVKKLFTLMGIPWVEATCEAEATCAALTKAGLVYATATEDMDALTFGTTRQLRGLHLSESRKIPVKEFILKRALEDMEMSMEQFVDMCILCGCDYTCKIRGIGPNGAYQMIKKHKNIEGILANLPSRKNVSVPEDFNYKGAREMFFQPDITDVSKLKPFKWGKADEKGLTEYLCGRMGFDPNRVQRGIERLEKAKGKSAQKRLDMFFKVIPSKKRPKKKVETKKGGTKRKRQSTANTSKKKAKKV